MVRELGWKPSRSLSLVCFLHHFILVQLLSRGLVRLHAQSCLTLCDPMDCSPPGSSVHGIFQARTLEWVAISSSQGSSQPNPGIRRVTPVSLAVEVDSLFTTEPSGKSCLGASLFYIFYPYVLIVPFSRRCVSFIEVFVIHWKLGELGLLSLVFQKSDHHFWKTTFSVKGG